MGVIDVDVYDVVDDAGVADVDDVEVADADALGGGGQQEDHPADGRARQCRQDLHCKDHRWRGEPCHCQQSISIWDFSDNFYQVSVNIDNEHWTLTKPQSLESVAPTVGFSRVEHK